MNSGNKNALIFVVGDTTDSAVEHINKLKPDFVFFIHSKGYNDKVKKIVNNTYLKDDSGKYDCKIIENHQKIIDSYAAALECIFELKKQNFHIIGDFTNATKTMSVGLAMACIEENCDTYYGGDISSESRDEFGRVRTGYGQLIPQENPNDTVYNREYKRGMLLFNRYQFEASLENFTQAKQTTDDTIKSRSGFLIKLVEFYDSWDKFNDELEKIRLDEYLKNILKTIKNDDDLNNYFSNEYPNFYTQMKNNLIFLGKKLDGNIFYYLPDLLNNAKRRIDEGKYDDAVARLYRAMELIAQLQLSRFNILDKDSLDSKTFAIDKAKLKKKASKKAFATIDSKHFKDWKSNKKTMELGLNMDYELLKILSEDERNELEKSAKELSKFYKNNVEGHVKLRNTSILAHGLRPLTKAESLRIYKLVLRHAEKLCSDINKEMELSKFPLFNG